MNGCYSEFTHPRQMAVVENFNSLGTVFSLGHWGDVLFDRGIPEEVTTDQFPSYILKKIVKKGGMELAEGLWSTWGIEGTFKAYLFSRVQELWEAIHIENLSARMRAFKSLYWAPRWTSTNLAIFASVHPITVPYYHNKMCEFIGGIPEEFLADRKLQIAYIKERNPKLAKVAWQAHKPFNLYNYHWDKTPWNLPYRVVKKAKREVNRLLGNPLIQRNWELQFKGKTNEQKLESYLFEPSFNQWIPRKMVQDFYDKFQKENPVYYSHAVSMLLTLAIKTQMDGAV